MRATMDQELDEVLASLGAEERREVLEYARSLRGEEDDDEDGGSVLHLIGCVSREDMRLMREVLEEDGLTAIVLVRAMGPPSQGEPPRRPGARGDGSARSSR